MPAPRKPESTVTGSLEGADGVSAMAPSKGTRGLLELFQLFLLATAPYLSTTMVSGLPRQRRRINQRVRVTDERTG